MSDDYRRFLNAFKAATYHLEIKEVARRMSVTTTTVYQWLNGMARMNAESVIRACWAFGIDMEVLYHAKWRSLS